MAGPPGLLAAAAGLALMGPSVRPQRARSSGRGQGGRRGDLPRAASGINVARIGAAFWALLTGLLVRWVTVRKAPART